MDENDLELIKKALDALSDIGKENEYHRYPICAGCGSSSVFHDTMDGLYKCLDCGAYHSHDFDFNVHRKRFQYRKT